MSPTDNIEYDREMHNYLMQGENFPHRPDEVQHIQTHISHVYIAPPFVYKIKKPVDFGFLDYSTLKKRKHFCEREVELNRRLCSGIYLGVTPISKEGDKYVMDSDSEGEIVEYAVKMNKLDGRYFLYSYIENDTLTLEQLDRVADKLAGFYRQQDPGWKVLKHGEIDRIRYNTDENFQQTEEFVGDTIQKESFDAIRYFKEQYFQRNKKLFDRRVEEKRIVDGHGDLHLDHIHIRPDGICIYDCIEFNERFRCGDLAVDLAFLVMDLDFQNCWKEGRYFIKQMSEKLEDPDLLQLIDFYKCYRAYVKGKVKSLQSTEEEVGKEGQDKARRTASRYFNLSLRYALVGSAPVVLIFMGRPATGKSTLAEYLASRMNVDHVSSDHIRKTIAGLPLDKRTPEDKRKELYSASMSEQTYKKLFNEAEEHVREGKSVILDATFSRPAERKAFIEELESMKTNYLFIEACAADETIRSRLASRRNEDGVISDARLEDFEMLDSRYRTPEEVGQTHLIKVATDRPLKETVEKLYKTLIDRRSELKRTAE